MGANLERIDVLARAIKHLPVRTIALAERALRGNLPLETWLAGMHGAGRKVTIIVMIDRLGDLIACSPIAQQLKERSPSTAIAWVCSRRFSDVFLGNPYLDAVFHEESLTGWLLTKRRVRQEVDTVELFLDSQRCCWTGIKLPNRHSGINHGNYLDSGRNLLLAYAQAAGLTDIRNVEPELYAQTPPPLPPVLRGKPLLAIHFDSEDPDRRVSRQSAVAFVAHAIARGWAVVELGMRPVAAQHIAEVHFPGTACRLAEHLTIMKQADHFVGVDSAFLHVANAYRIPATLLLGKFRHFPAFETFSGSFFHSGCCTLYRGNHAMSAVPPRLVEELVPDIPP